MALGAQIYTFEGSLSHVDRSVYETLELKVARHPSETLDYMVTRVLAYGLEHRPGIEFTRGVSEGDEPAIWVKDLTGALEAWIEVGSPEADRVHRASKAAGRVAVYSFKDPTLLLRKLAAKKIHRADEIPVYTFEKGFIESFAALVDRRTTFDLSVTERRLYLDVGNRHLESDLVEHRIDAEG